MSCVFQETPLSWSCLVAANHLTGHRQNKPSHWSFYMMILWTRYSICISCQRKGYHHAADLLITRGRKEQPETKRKEAGTNKMALPPSLTTRVGSPGTQGGRTEPIPASCPLTTCKQWNICAYTQDKNKSKCAFKKKKNEKQHALLELSKHIPLLLSDRKRRKWWSKTEQIIVCRVGFKDLESGEGWL